MEIKQFDILCRKLLGRKIPFNPTTQLTRQELYRLGFVLAANGLPPEHVYMEHNTNLWSK